MTTIFWQKKSPRLLKPFFINQEIFRVKCFYDEAQCKPVLSVVWLLSHRYFNVYLYTSAVYYSFLPMVFEIFNKVAYHVHCL